MQHAVERTSRPGRPSSRRTRSGMRRRSERFRERWSSEERRRTMRPERSSRRRSEREMDRVAAPRRSRSWGSPISPSSSLAAAAAPMRAFPNAKREAKEKNVCEVAIEETRERKRRGVNSRKAEAKTAICAALLRPGKRSARLPRSAPIAAHGRISARGSGW